MRNYAFAIMLVCSYLAVSQNCKHTLSGKVLDLHDGSILSGATLVVAETESISQTSIDGDYTILGLCENITYSIRILHSSCETKTFYVKISEDTQRDFKLEHHLEELNEIILEGKAYKNNTNTKLENNVSKEIF